MVHDELKYPLTYLEVRNDMKKYFVDTVKFGIVLHKSRLKWKPIKEHVNKFEDILLNLV